MGFGSSNYKKSESEDPYALEINDDYLTRPKRKHKSVIKQNKIFKNCSSHLSVDISRPQDEHLCGSSQHLSQDVSPHINRRTIYKHNRTLELEKPYRFFKSRNTFLLSGENLKSEIHSKCVPQEYSNVKYSSKTHCLSDTRNEEKERSFTTQDVTLFPSNSLINQNTTNDLTASKAIMSPKEQNIFSSILRTLPCTSLEEAIPALSEDHTLSLKSIKKLHYQLTSRIEKPIFQKYKKVLHQQKKETLTKSKKFFKSWDRNAISKCNLGYANRNSCTNQDKESFNVEKCKSGNVLSTNMKPVSKDPYSFDAEDDNYSNKQDEEFNYVNTEHKGLYQDRRNTPSTEKCSFNSKSQSNYPYSFEMKGGLTTRVNKNFKCIVKQKGLKSFNDQFSTEAEHLCTMHGCMQSADSTKPKILHSSGKQNAVSTNNKSVNQPSVDNIRNQSKREHYLPVVNTSINNIYQPTNGSDEVQSLPKSSEIGLNSCGKRKHQVDTNHLSSSLTYAGENGKPQNTATSSKKCSIAYTYVIKNTLSVVTQKRSSPKDINTESIHEQNKQTYDTHFTSGKINCQNENINNKESCQLTCETKSKVSSVIRNLSKLNINLNLTEIKHTRANNVTDNNEEVNFMPSSYTFCNKAATVKPSLESKEINSTHSVDVSAPKSLKQTKSASSCISFTKNIDTDIEISHSENEHNHLITDQCITDETKNHIKNTTEDLQLSCSPQRKDSQKMLGNTFTDGIQITKSCQNATISSREKHKMNYHLKTKDNTKNENLIKLQVNSIPTNIKTTEKDSGSETECTAKQAMNSVNKKPIIKRGSTFKKRIFASTQRKKSRLVYRHRFVDDIEGDKGTKLMSPTGLLVQPVAIINSDHELEEVRSPLLCVASKHIQTTKFTNNAEAESKEIDKKYFTVIKNVKKSDHIQELGDLQQFNDDVEYILDALQDCNPITTRCHSALILASKCLIPEFRKHVEAYDTVTKFSCALHDAAENQYLALCAATIMLVFSQYQIITCMSSSSIHLLLSLLNARLKYETESVQLQNIKKKVLELCVEVQSQGFVKHLLHENVTANHLASEVLLKLTSYDTGYLFEDRLREMGGLKHIIMAIMNCRREIDGFFVQWRGDLIDKLRFLNCCLQILECVTDLHEENQLYVLKYEGSCFMGTMAALLSKCTGEIRSVHQFKGTAGVVTLEVLFTILKILINLSHSNNNTSFGSSLVARRPEMIHTSLYVLLQATSYVPEEKKFDLLALVLMFLINTVENNICNRKLIFGARASDIMMHNSNNKRTVNVLIELFYEQEKLARIEEFKTNAMLDDQIGSELSPQPLEPSQEFIAILQEKAGQNMEYTMIASYIVLLIGYLIVDNEEYELYVRQCLPQRSFSTMISVLEKMHNFLNIVPAISSKKDITQTQHIIQCLKQADEKARVGSHFEHISIVSNV